MKMETTVPNSPIGYYIIYIIIDYWLYLIAAHVSSRVQIDRGVIWGPWLRQL